MTEFNEISQHYESYSHDMILGRLAWYSIPEITLNYQHFVMQLHKYNLADYVIPLPPRSPDVFRRACTKSETKRVHAPNGMLLNYFISEVGKDNTAIWRQLVRETVDKNERCLEYTPLVELVFDRATHLISTKILVDFLTPIEQNIVANLHAHYAAMKNELSSYTTRQTIMKILTKMKATTVRPTGGVYFIKESYYEPLSNLEELVNTMSEGTSFHTLPLLDDKKQREMLRKAFEDESAESVDRSLEEIRKILVNGISISPEKYSAYFEDFQELTAKTQEYAELLEEELGVTNSRLELYQEQVFNLLERVK